MSFPKRYKATSLFVAHLHATGTEILDTKTQGLTGLRDAVPK